MNKRQEKKRLKKMMERLITARNNGECIAIITQVPVYKNGQIVGIQTHPPTLKVLLKAAADQISSDVREEQPAGRTQGER